MINDTRTADDIERDIENERAQMSGSINDLQRKFSVEGIVSDVGAMFRDQGGDAGRYIKETVGRNPAAVALVGVGLAWLLLGKGRASTSAAGRYDRDQAPGGNVGRPLPTGRRAKSALSDAEYSWFDDDSTAHTKRSYQTSVGKTNGATEPATGVMGTVRNGTDAVVEAVSAPASAVRDAALALTEKLSSGFEGLSEEARARVLDARRMAHDAKVASQTALKEGAQTAANLFADQPLVMGALAIALGAAFGGLLPHTKIEDDNLGANSDRLFAEAERVFREERDKVTVVIKAAAKEASGALKDTGAELADLLPDGKTAGDMIVGHVSDAASRVANAARDEAARQGLTGDRQS